MEVEIRPYRPVEETTTLRNWLSIDRLTDFRAEAHVCDGEAFVEVDFQYGEGTPYHSIRVEAGAPSDVVFMRDPAGDGTWEEAKATDVVYEDAYEAHPLTLGDLEPLARNFVEEHFWNNEEV